MAWDEALLYPLKDSNCCSCAALVQQQYRLLPCQIHIHSCGLLKTFEDNEPFSLHSSSLTILCSFDRRTATGPASLGLGDAGHVPGGEPWLGTERARQTLLVWVRERMPCNWTP